MRFALSALLLAATALPAQAEGFIQRELSAQERAAVEESLRSALPAGAVLADYTAALSLVEPDVGRVCGHAQVDGEAVPYAVDLGWDQTGTALGKLIGGVPDAEYPEAAVPALKACGEIGVDLQ